MSTNAMFSPSPDRRPVAATRDLQPDTLLQNAKRGCPTARRTLFRYVYENGQMYFIRKVAVERILSTQEAQDLAGESLLEFQKTWLKIRCLEHYMMRMFRNNLMRFLTKKRHRNSKVSLHIEAGIDDLDLFQSDHEGAEKKRSLSDLETRRLLFSRKYLSNCDPMTQTIVWLRLGDDALTYREIEPYTGMSESAMRMRFARFCKSTKTRFEKKEGSRAHHQFN